MNILASPILWILAGVFYFFFKKDGLDHSAFLPPTKESGLTITKAKAKNIASSLLEKFNEFFTEEAEVLFLLNGLNEKDFLLVYDSFGVKTKSIFGTFESETSVGAENDLIQWINLDVKTPAMRKRLSNQFPNIF
jgi:hypothetical protein